MTQHKRIRKSTRTSRRKGRSPNFARAVPRGIDPVYDYARQVDDGELVAGPLVRRACRRHLDDLEHAAERGLSWRRDEALYAIRAFGFFRHSKGEWANKPITLEPWQQFIVGSVFGWYRDDGFRRFRTVYQEVPRKNGKSTMLAGIGLYLLDFDNEPGAEIYAAATKRDQARIVFGEAQRMVRKSNALRERIDLYKLNLSVTATDSKFEPLSADDKTADGLNPHGIVIDELHRHKTRAMLDVLDTAVGSRLQPLLWIITTAGDDSAETVYSDEHEYARKVVEGSIQDESLFVYIASIDDGDDLFAEATWRKANPNFGISVRPDDMRRQAEKARRSPSALAAFKRLRLNVRVSGVEHGIGADLWKGCGGKFDPDSLEGRRCIGGLDLGGKNDLASLVLLFEPIDPGGISEVLPFFWTCDNDLEGRETRDRVNYRQWRDDGFLTIVDSPTVQNDWIAEQIGEQARKYEIAGIAADRWGFEHLGPALERAGIEYWTAKRREDGTIETDGQGLRFVMWGQGYRDMGPAVTALEDALQERRLRHAMHPVLTWNAASVVYGMDPATDWRKPLKRRSTGRIDGIVALMMAAGLANLSTTATASIYDTNPEAILG